MRSLLLTLLLLACDPTHLISVVPDASLPQPPPKPTWEPLAYVTPKPVPAPVLRPTPAAPTDAGGYNGPPDATTGPAWRYLGVRHWQVWIGNCAAGEARTVVCHQAVRGRQVLVTDDGEQHPADISGPVIQGNSVLVSGDTAVVVGGVACSDSQYAHVDVDVWECFP